MINFNRNKTLVIAIVMGLSTSSLFAMTAAIMKEGQIYHRCHGQMVRERPAATDTRLAQVYAGTLSGVDACMELLALADLNPGTGKLETGAGTGFDTYGGYSTIGVNILRTFNDFHREWFPSDNLSTSLGLDTAGPQYDFTDTNVASYFVTNALFSSKPYSSIVTDTDRLKAKRYSAYPRFPAFIYSSSSNGKFGYGDVDVMGQRPDWNVPKIEVGILVGLAVQAPLLLPITSNNFINDYLYDGNTNAYKTEAGALGTSGYYILNSGRGKKEVLDGAAVLPRRWSRAVFNDFLCRDVPVVRKSDAMALVDNSGTSPLPFRASSSCMQCHASMDTAARVRRNARVIPSSKNSLPENAVAYLVHEAKVDRPAHANEYTGWIDDSDAEFFRRPPAGKLYFRTYDGELIDEQITGVSDLGQKISTLDDLYLCASKRYFQFLTGVDLPLFDKGDINAPTLNLRDKAYRQFLVEAAKELKVHQDPKKTIKKIISSNFYME